jgi:hypothetical protein
VSKRTIVLSALGAIAALVIGWQVAAFAGSVLTNSGFEADDGNLVDDTGNTLIDWNTFSRVTWLPSPTTTPNRTADKTASGYTFKGIEDWQATGADSSFAGGTKQDDDCASVISAKAPNKDDMKRIYLSSKTGADGHTYLNLAWVRIPQNTTSASAHIGFEFNKGTTACPAGSDGLVRRTAGDMLVVYDFEGGGGTPVITLRRWVTSGACEVSSNSAPCWGTATNLTAANFAEAKVNTGTSVLDQLAPPALSSTTGTSVNDTLNDSEFGEAGIDLTAAGVFTAGTCNTFGKAYAVSRSSGNSGTAQMKDLVGPANFTLTNCGQVHIIKQTSPAGLNQNFSYTSGNSSLSGTCTIGATNVTSPVSSFTLNDNANATDSLDCTNVPAGTYTVTEGADPAGFTFTDLSCTATGTGTSATPTSGSATRTASITMAGGGDVTCTYTNTQQLGAIKITKTRKHAADGPGDHPHAGVSFTVNGVTKQTDSNGQACFDGLAFASYTVHETVPAGYHVDANDKQVTVDNNAKCSDDPYGGESVSFHNTPLTDISASVNSQVNGGTASTITCKDGNGNTVASGSTDANGDGSASASDLEPGTYTCTLVVDP